MKKVRWLPCIAATALGALCLTSCAPAQGVDYDVNAYRTTMQFHDNFKILQLADLHFGIESDLQKQLDFMTAAVKAEDPDLVVLTGDNFMYASKSIVYHLFNNLNAVCKELTDKHPERLTKFAVTYGNHDNQGDYSRYYINSVVQTFAAKDGKEIESGKYAAFVDYEDDDLFGLTNYFIDLVDDREKSVADVDVKYRLHIIDSNTYHYMGTKYAYDIIHDEQLAHVQDVYDNATTDKDYIGMAFFHIPLTEFWEAKEQYESAADPSLIGQGEWREGILCGYKNNDAYAKLRAANVLSFIVGHDHINYGEVIYNAHSANVDDKAIFSYGVKSTNQLYHDDDMLGYKTITLKDGMTKEQFLSIGNVNANFRNKTDRGDDYE